MEEKYSLGVRSHCYYLFLSGNTNGLRREAMETRIQNNWPGCWTRQPWPGRKTQQPYSSSLASVILQLPIHCNKSFSSSVRFLFFFYGLNSQRNSLPCIQAGFSSSVTTPSFPNPLSAQAAIFGKPQMRWHYFAKTLKYHGYIWWMPDSSTGGNVCMMFLWMFTLSKELDTIFPK